MNTILNYLYRICSAVKYVKLNNAKQKENKKMIYLTRNKMNFHQVCCLITYVLPTIGRQTYFK